MTKRRPRSRFTEVQKQGMLGLAERLGWGIQTRDLPAAMQFCSDTGVTLSSFKAWMSNNKRPAAPTPALLKLAGNGPVKTDEASPPPPKNRGRGRSAKRDPEGTDEEPLAAKKKVRPFVVVESEVGLAASGSGPQDQGDNLLEADAEAHPVRAAAAAPAPADLPEPSTGPSTAAAPPQHVHGFECELFQKKVEIIQTRIKDAVAVLKPRLVGDGSTYVKAAIIELEAIAAMNMRL